MPSRGLPQAQKVVVAIYAAVLLTCIWKWVQLQPPKMLKEILPLVLSKSEAQKFLELKSNVLSKDM